MVNGKINGGIAVTDGMVNKKWYDGRGGHYGNFVNCCLKAQPNKARRYKLGRDKHDKLTASLSYYDSDSDTWGNYTLVYTAAAVTKGRLFFFAGGANGHGWVASHLQTTVATVAPFKVCPEARPNKPFDSKCADTTCSVDECCAPGSCTTDFKPSILDVQRTLLTSKDWRIKPTQKMLDIGYNNGYKRYTVGDGTMSLTAGLQDEFLRTEPFGFESGEMNFEVQVDTYTSHDSTPRNWLIVAIGTELHGDRFDTQWYTTPNTLRFYQGDMQLSLAQYGGIHLLDSPTSATAAYVLRNVPGTSGKPRRYRLGRNKDNRLTASLSYYDSGTDTYGNYTLLYTSTAVTKGQLYLMVGGTGGNGWTASRLQKTVQTVVPTTACPGSRPNKPFTTACADATCTTNECCIATCDRESDCTDENSPCQSELQFPAPFCAMFECDGKGASSTTFSVLAPVGAAGSIDGAHHVAAADVDGDGNLDLLSAAQLDGTVAWFKGAGSGSAKTFGTKQIIVSGNTGVRCVVAADFNGDGHVDVASASQRANTVEVYLNNHDGTSWNIVVVDNNIPGAVFVVAVDLDGDGFVDLASAAYTPAASNEQGSTNDQISWYKGNGDGTFGQKQVVSDVDSGYTSVAAADIDGDGLVDLASTSYHSSATHWYKNLGGGQFSSPNSVDDPGSTKGAYDVKLADLDGDGLIDAVVAADVDDTVAWHQNLGQMGFGPKQIVTSHANGAMSVAVADINSDGRVDIACTSYIDDTVQWFENRGRGTFGAAQVVTANADQVSYLIAVDLDGDGAVDLASASYLDDQIEWYRNLGSAYVDQSATSGTCTLKPNAGVDDIASFCVTYPEEPFCFPTCITFDANNCTTGTSFNNSDAGTALSLGKCESPRCAAADCCAANPPCKGVADLLAGAQDAGSCASGELSAASKCLQTPMTGFSCTATHCTDAGTVLRLGECTANPPPTTTPTTPATPTITTADDDVQGAKAGGASADGAREEDGPGNVDVDIDSQGSGEVAEVPVQPSKVPAIAGGVAGGGIFLILLLVLFIFCKKGKGGGPEEGGTGVTNGDERVVENPLYASGSNNGDERLAENPVYVSNNGD